MLMQERSLAVQNHENKRNKWILDSGASSHVSYEKEYFNELNEDETSEIEIADGNVVKAIGAGTVNLKFNVDHETINTKITEVKFAPKLNCNLLSVSSLDRKGFKITFEKGQCIVTKHDEVYVEGKLKDGVYELNISENQRNQSTRMAQPSKRDQASVEPRSEEFVFYPFEPIQSTNPPSSVVTPPIGDTQGAAEVQAPGSTRDEEDEEQLYGDIPLLEEDEEGDAVGRPEVRHSSRTYRGVPPLRLSYLTRSASPQEPSKWEEIERMPPDEASLWRKAAQEEIDALHRNRTWTLTELPPAFVDDLLISTSNEKDYKDIVKHLNREVEVKELGKVKYYLGIQVERAEDGSFLLSQRQKITELIESMQMQDAHPVATPMATDFLKNQQDLKLLPNNTQYGSAIGKLLYLVTTCRPDLASAVGILSGKNPNTLQLWRLAERSPGWINS
ncbi:uncharacterized protein LOC118078985 isoform X5 [Zootoca vivipara]|uniref:uncharacterized protein LOC118078985 isoform X5 n=1 Tax=Zootoca vivipara TaxID=8524 RepID=UPI00293C0800|nr:uncharacterized protein LOC118078985 isoform X5 [Zootoca vivipara]